MASQGSKLLFLLLGAAAVGTHAMSLRDVLETRADLSESAAFARQSGVLEDIDSDEYGSDITVLFPSNAAWQNVSEARKAYLRDPINREDLETLLLFSTTDANILKQDIYPGMPPLVTLLGVEATVDAFTNEICVLSMMSGENYSCANVVTWDVPMDGGVLHIIDKVLFPEELEEVLNYADSVEVSPWRRLQDSAELTAAEKVEEVFEDVAPVEAVSTKLEEAEKIEDVAEEATEADPKVSAKPEEVVEQIGQETDDQSTRRLR